MASSRSSRSSSPCRDIQPSCPTQPSSPPQSSPLPPSISQRLGLGNLTVHRIPGIDYLATIKRLADEQYRQLDTDPSAQDTLIFYGATPAQVDFIVKLGYPGRITYFGEDRNGLLFFRMLTRYHEYPHLNLLTHFHSQATRMNRGKSLDSTGTAQYESIHGGKYKQGDSGVLPYPLRYGKSLPTLVIECGSNESLPRLHKDRDWWFDNSVPRSQREDVKIVITIKVSRLTCCLLIEQWHRQHNGKATQSITISAKDPKQLSFNLRNWQSHWQIKGGPLVVSFRDIFLQEPGLYERNFVIEEEELVSLAMGTFRE